MYVCTTPLFALRPGAAFRVMCWRAVWFVSVRAPTLRIHTNAIRWGNLRAVAAPDWNSPVGGGEIVRRILISPHLTFVK